MCSSDLGLLNYRWVFSARRFLQSAVASGTSNPQLGGPVIRMFQLPPGRCTPSLKRPERIPAARILPKMTTSTSLLCSFTCRKFRTCDRRLYFRSEGRRAEDFFHPKKKLGYQRLARSLLDHRSRFTELLLVLQKILAFCECTSIKIEWRGCLESEV